VTPSRSSVSSGPLPASRTVSPADAPTTACRIASRRSPIEVKFSCPPSRAPRSISARISASGVSRWSSSVNTARSASRVATAPRGARFEGSRGPPADPSTTHKAPAVVARTVASAFSSDGGVCAKSTITRTSLPGTSSIRPGTPRKLANPATSASTPTPSRAAAAVPASAFATLNRPIIGSAASNEPTGDSTRNRSPRVPSATSRARQSAKAEPSAEYVHSDGATPRSCSTHGSSVFSTANGERSTSFRLSAK